MGGGHYSSAKHDSPFMPLFYHRNGRGINALVPACFISNPLSAIPLLPDVPNVTLIYKHIASLAQHAVGWSYSKLGVIKVIV
jgi:hypothetical protein